MGRFYRFVVDAFRKAAIAIGGTVILGEVVRGVFGDIFKHALYGGIVDYLELAVGLKAADMIAQVISHIVPIGIAGLVVWIVWTAASASERRKHNKPTAISHTQVGSPPPDTFTVNLPPPTPAPTVVPEIKAPNSTKEFAAQPLPPNATFSFKGRVFYFIKHNYSHEENVEFRAALRDAYDCIFQNAAPISATYDGPVVRFTRNWISIIQNQGAETAS
jgi:hypothetical protein